MNKNLLGVGLASAITFTACGQDNASPFPSQIELDDTKCHEVTVAVTNQPQTVLIIDGYTKNLTDHGKNLLTAEIEICQGVRTRIEVVSSNDGSLYLISKDEDRFGINLFDLETDTKISCIASENSSYVQYVYSIGLNDLEVEVTEGSCN